MPLACIFREYKHAETGWRRAALRRQGRAHTSLESWVGAPFRARALIRLFTPYVTDIGDFFFSTRDRTPVART